MQEEVDSLLHNTTSIKWINKGNDMQEEADALLHNTTSYTQLLYQISKPEVQ